jgi:hypothetical protein
MSREEINRLLKSMGYKSGGIDAIFLHILEAVAVVNSLEYRKLGEEKLAGAKRRIFWKALRDIADYEINKTISRDEPILEVLEAFPDQEKKRDGRTWLPMHFAMLIPNIALDDVDILFESHPRASNSNVASTICLLLAIWS